MRVAGGPGGCEVESRPRGWQVFWAQSAEIWPHPDKPPQLSFESDLQHPSSEISLKKYMQETVVNSHQYEINFYWRYWLFLTLFFFFFFPPKHVSQWSILLFSLVLIFLSGMALNTHISCLLSFLLPVSVESKPHKWYFYSRRAKSNVHSGLSCAGPSCLRQWRPLTAQQPLSPPASPPSEPRGDGVTGEDRADRNRERERRAGLKRNEDDSRNERWHWEASCHSVSM